MCGMELKDFVLANPAWISSGMMARLHNALQDITYSTNCLHKCWKTACEISCKKYGIEIIYDNREAIDEAEYWTCVLVRMCNS